MSNICPKCKEEINWLKAYSETKYDMGLNDKGEIEYERMYDIDYFISFECPECDEELFTQEGEATEFLENKDELQRIVKEKLKKIKKERR